MGSTRLDKIQCKAKCTTHEFNAPHVGTKQGGRREMEGSEGEGSDGAGVGERESDKHEPGASLAIGPKPVSAPKKLERGSHELG